MSHIIPIAAGGASDEANLWLSCAWCNNFKRTQTDAVDPVSGESVPLFNPRKEPWSEHFRWNAEGTLILGITANGRATVEALRLNNQFIVPARRQWTLAGWHPPKD